MIYLKKVKNLDFITIIWFVSVIGLVFLYSAAVIHPIFFLFALAFAVVLFLFALFTPYTQNKLFLTVMFLIVFNGSYHPFFGIFSGINGYPSEILRYALALRSVWYVALLAIIACIFIHTEACHLARLGKAVIFLCVVILIDSVLSNASISGRITYLLNSFLPLVFTIFHLGAISASPSITEEDSAVTLKVIISVSIFSICYFFLLPITYDFFRPDLGSFLRLGPGEFIPRGGYDPSWGTKIQQFVFNRFVGTFPDPIIAGYFLASMTFMMLMVRRTKLAIYFSILLFISLSKGAWLFLGQAIILYHINKRSKSMMFIAALSMAFIQLGMATILDASNKIHLLGLQGGTASIFRGGIKTAILGFGVGDGGNLGQGAVESIFSASWLISGAESGVGVFIHQLGLMGLVSMIFLYKQFFNVTKNSAKLNNDDTSLAIEALLISLTINMLLQENCINASVLSSVLFSAILMKSLNSNPEQRNPAT